MAGEGQVLNHLMTAAAVLAALNGNAAIALTSPVSVPLGSAAAPSLSFGTDQTTGFYSAGAGKIDIAISGTKVGEWTSTGLSTSQQITSTVSTGTAPLIVASTTAVANLNASLLLGGTWASPGAIGGTAASTGKFTSVTDTGLTSGRVTFATTGGLLTDAAALTWNGTIFNVGGTVTGTAGSFVSSGAGSLVTIGDNAGGSFSQLQILGGSAHYNFQIDVQAIAGNTFSITPSTATGGLTFSTPALQIAGATGAVTVGAGGLTVTGLATLTGGATAAAAFRRNASASSDVCFSTYYTSSNLAFFVSADGTLNWGPSTAGIDTTLARTGVASVQLAGALSVTTTLAVSGNATIGNSANALLTLTTSTNGNSRAIMFKDTAGSKFNWQIGAQINVSDVFEITPSTAAGGTTFSNPALLAYPTGSIVIGALAALATGATDGFLYIPTCAGTPTGAPTARTGKVAIVYDTTNNKIAVYNGAWKQTVALT